MPTASSSPGILFYPRISITGTVGDSNPATLVTATCEIDHGFNIGDTITVSGSDVSAHNVTKVIVESDGATIFKYDLDPSTDTGTGGAATVVGVASQLGIKLVGGANTYLSKNSSDVMVTAAGADGDIEGITTATNSGLSGGATSGSPTLTLDINNLTGVASAAADSLAFSDDDNSNAIRKATIVDVVTAGATGLPNNIFANVSGYMSATNDTNTKWNDGSSEMADLAKDAENRITFWTYLAGDTATRDSMSGGVFTASVTTAGTYLVTAKVQFHAEDNAGLGETDAAFYSLSLLSYVHASGGGEPSSGGVLVDLAKTVNYTAWIGETLETTFTVNIPDADTFAIYSRIQITGAGDAGTNYSHQAGAANGSSLAMIKIGPAT
jgi:hypothetical protein